MLLSLLIYIQFDFSEWSLFGNGVFRHHIASSPFDVFLIAILRSSLILGCTLGRSCSKDKLAANRRLRKLTPLVAIVTILMMSYLVVKFLVSEEYDKDGHLITHQSKSPTDTPSMTPNTTSSESNSPYHPWLWGMLSWSAFATSVAAVEYYLLCQIKDDIKQGYQRLIDRNLSVVGINSAVEDNDEQNDSESGSDSDSNTKEERQSDSVKSSASPRATVWRLLKMSKPDIGFLVIGFFFLSLAAASDTFQPYYFGQVIDSIAIEQNESKFAQAIFIICGLSLVSALGAGLRGMSFLVAMARLNIRIRNLLFGSLTKQEIGFFDTTRTGNITSRLTSDTTKMSDQLTLNLNIFLRSSARALGCLVFMFSLSWKMTIVVLLEVPIIGLITHYYGKYYKVCPSIHLYYCIIVIELIE